MVEALAVFLGVLSSFFIAYLLLHLAAAALPRRPRATTAEGVPVVVVIPAHDEELTIGATLASLAAQEVPPAEVLVIADNCADETARIAREAGATVWERVDPTNRGKGFALAWAVERLLETPMVAIAVLDADTQADPTFCREIGCALADAGAVQGRYGVLSPKDGWRVGLMSAAFALVNHIRPLGADRLGGFVGLKGNGMGFRRDVLARVRWRGESVTEDLDFALDLALAGVRVRYAPEACVAAQMPSSEQPATTQRRRWEGGRARLLRKRALPMLLAGKFGASLELLSPPLAELLALLSLWGALAWATPVGSLQAWWLTGALGFGIYVLGGLLVARTTPEVWLALLRAPLYVLWKLALRGTGPRGQGEWVRTARKRGETTP